MKRIGIKQIIKAMSGRLINEDELENGYITHVVRDSREVKKDGLYLALVGERVDGHDYIERAFEQGALIAVAQDQAKIPENRPVILVENTEKALGDLAAYYRQQFDIPFIGITGSVGKTSTKEMVASILGQRYKVHKTNGNYNNNIGMPLTLLQLEESHEVAVIEMGMDRFGEIDYLSNILKPDYGVITNIGVSHIEFLGSREGILKAKTEMLPHIANSGKIILNGDDRLLKSIAPKYGRRVLCYGKEEGNDCRMIHHESKSEGQSMTIATSKHIYDVKVPYPGEHIVFNGLAGVLLGECMGLGSEEIIKGIKAYVGADMRLQRFDVDGKIRIVDDAYNASVESMESALKTLNSMVERGERTVAVLGSMFEMGTYTEEGHRRVGQMVTQLQPDLLLVAGTEAKSIYDGAIDSGYDSDKAFYYEDRDGLIEDLDNRLDVQDLVLLKASRGMHFEAVRKSIIGKFEGE